MSVMHDRRMELTFVLSRSALSSWFVEAPGLSALPDNSARPAAGASPLQLRLRHAHDPIGDVIRFPLVGIVGVAD